MLTRIGLFNVLTITFILIFNGNLPRRFTTSRNRGSGNSPVISKSSSTRRLATRHPSSCKRTNLGTTGRRTRRRNSFGISLLRTRALTSKGNGNIRQGTGNRRRRLYRSRDLTPSLQTNPHMPLKKMAGGAHNMHITHATADLIRWNGPNHVNRYISLPHRQEQAQSHSCSLVCTGPSTAAWTTRLS